MKVVIAIDSFKGSMTSMEAGHAAEEGIKKVHPDAEVIVKPLADGGEGTVDALVEGLGGEYVTARVKGPMGSFVTSRYGIMDDEETAIMEMAQAGGIILVDRNDLDPWRANTEGVGEMIRNAIDRGCRKFLIGIGGSATTEGGIGMLTALGYEFYDKKGRLLSPIFENLGKIEKISADNVLPELSECHFQIACDVTNPLCGENGAVYVYGPQKGVRLDERVFMDSQMRQYAKKTADFLGKDYSEYPGAGAAGGLGFAFLSYMPNVELRPGIRIVLDAVKFEESLEGADYVITGEGRLDSQTANGKVPVGVARIAKKYGAKVLAFAGGVTNDAGACNQEGIDAFFPIVRGVCTLDEAMDNFRAKENMALSVEQVFRLL